ncbi:CBS domain-containing protein [Candidatus Woesearchaeota archaeon]|nr:CBS domain-containing protein [Candidatus Woesearchaeota archaeon]
MEIKDIKKIRKELNLTQTELAKKSKVSQSLIAKIEAGRLDPTYSNAKKIFNTLNEITQKQTIKAEEIMMKKVISVNPESDLKDIIRQMRRHDISQVIVQDREKLIGFVSEKDVLDAFTKGAKGTKAKDIMGEAPPTISKKASITIVSDLLKAYPIVAVMEKGKIIGVITKSDILRKAYKKGLI